MDRHAFSHSLAAEVLEIRQLLSTITVTSLADNATTDGLVTLREALTAANSNRSVDGCTAGQTGVQDVIVFQPGLTGTIHLALGQLPISDSVHIVGLGAASTVIDGGGLSRVFAATSAAGNVEFDYVTISGGKTTANAESGAGIQYKSTGTLTLLNSVVSNNATAGFHAYGAGIFTGSGAVTMTNCVLAGNSTTGSYACGGGVFTGRGALTVLNSTVTGNSTAGLYSHGGGMYSQVGDVTVTNSTFFGNSTNGVESYGGGFTAWAGNVVVTNSTITQNVANYGDRSEGGGFCAAKGSITLINSIVSGNTCSSGFGPDIKFNNFAYTATAKAYHSFIGVNTNHPRFAYPFQPAPLGHPDANGNLIGTAAAPINAMLAAAANNGGWTETIAPLAGSPAIDAGSNALAVDPMTHVALQYDQRGAGFSRILGGTIDMGAFEYVASSSVLTDTTPVTNQIASEGSDTGSVVLMTFSDSNALAAQTDFTISSLNWGTGAVSNASAQVELVSRSADASQWRVVGHATYAEAGSDTVAVTVHDNSGNPVSTSNTSFRVADGVLSDTTPLATINGTAVQANTNVVLMTFTDANPVAPASDFSVQSLAWGGTLAGTAPTLIIVADPSYSGPGCGWKVIADTVTYANAGSYRVTLTVHDADASNISTSNTTFSVAAARENHAPTDISLSNSTVAENSAIGTFVGTLTTTDPDAEDTATYSLVAGDTSEFSISGNSLVTNAAFDYETKNTYTVTIRTTDSGGQTFDKQFTINVTDVNDAPSFTKSLYTFDVNSKSLVGAAAGIAPATDPDTTAAFNTLTYSISAGDPNHVLAINSSTGVVTVLNPGKLPTIAAGHSSATAPDISLSVTDGTLTATTTLRISSRLGPFAMTPLAASKAPTFKRNENNVSGAVAAALTINPAYTGQTILWGAISDSLGGFASSIFAYSPSVATTGTTATIVLKPGVKLDFETQNSYTFFVTVADSRDSSKTVTTPLTLNVNDINDAPRISLSSDGIAGAPTSPLKIGKAAYTINEYTQATSGNSPIKGDTLFHLSATDQDAGSSVKYALTGIGVTSPSPGVYIDKSGAFKFDAATSAVTVVDATRINYEKFKNGISLAFAVSDNGEPGPTGVQSKPPKPLTTNAIVTILLNDLNDPPKFASAAAKVNIPENNKANAGVFIAQATDADAPIVNGVATHQHLSYSIVSAVNGVGADVSSSFAIDPTTGKVTVVPANVFDFESSANKTFTLVLRATDDGSPKRSTADSAIGDQTLTVHVTDRNEAPFAVFTPIGGPATTGNTGSLNISAAASSVGMILGKLSFGDPDGRGLGYGPDTLKLATNDSSSASKPALIYDSHTGNLVVGSLATLNSNIGKSFTFTFAVKDKNGGDGALAFVLKLTINVTA